MAKKCVHCGKSVGLLNPGFELSYDEHICNKCWSALGFSDADKAQFGGRSYSFIKNGKDRCLEIWAEAKRKAEAQHEAVFPIVGTRYENDAGKKIQRILKEILADSTDEDYGGMTNKDIKEDGNCDERIYRYEMQEVEAGVELTEFEGSPAIKVYILDPDPVHIGWIPKNEIRRMSKLINKPDLDCVATIYGGDYKVLTYDDEIEKDSIDFGARLTVTYSE